MSVLDGLTENRTDVSEILRDEERLIVCPADKRPADYLMLDKTERITLLVSIFEGYAPKRVGSYSQSVSQNILDYIYSVPYIRDISIAVLGQFPLYMDDVRYDLVSVNYEEYLFQMPKYPNHNNWMLTVSFCADVRSYYSLMKLVRGLYMCTARFNFTSSPVIRFRNDNDDSACFIKFDKEFMNGLGIRDDKRVPSMVPGYILTVMCQLARHIGLLEKYNSDEDADKVRITDEIERWSIRLKNRNKRMKV